MSKSLAEKVRDAAYFTRKPQSEIIEKALLQYFDKKENENGSNKNSLMSKLPQTVS
ncbi:MAG: hypothetical protein H8D45_20820 [Bacteroidetes bacterium]|nr:hypothetical protein [Bacteroidota bacterium]